MYTIEELDGMNDQEVEDMVNKRGQKFIKILSDCLKGEEIKAFGAKGEGIWGQSENTLNFNIKKIKLTSGMVFINENKAQMSLDIYLTGYNDSKSHGMMYTDNIGEKSIRNLIQNLIGKEAKVGWSEQGMQGNNYVNVDLSIPSKMLAPDINNYYNYLEKLKKMKEKSSSRLEPVEKSWPAKMKK